MHTSAKGDKKRLGQLFKVLHLHTNALFKELSIYINWPLTYRHLKMEGYGNSSHNTSSAHLPYSDDTNSIYEGTNF